MTQRAPAITAVKTGTRPRTEPAVSEANQSRPRTSGTRMTQAKVSVPWREPNFISPLIRRALPHIRNCTRRSGLPLVDENQRTISGLEARALHHLQVHSGDVMSDVKRSEGRQKEDHRFSLRVTWRSIGQPHPRPLRIAYEP